MASVADAAGGLATRAKSTLDNIQHKPPAVRAFAFAGVSFVAMAFYIEVLRILLVHNQPPRGEFVWGGIVGLLYAMVAFGLILIHRANRIINFAQGEIGAVPAVLAVLLMKVHHVPYLVAFALAMVVGGLSGFLVEFLVIRRFAKAPRLVLSVVTIGVGLIFAAIQFYLPKWLSGEFIVDPKPPKTPFSSVKFRIYPLVFSADHIVIFVAAILVVIGLTAFFRMTDTGMAVRASAENSDRAVLLGISVKRLSTVVWVLAALLSTLGVFLKVPLTGLPIGADVGPYVLLYGLAAAVIARMESFPIALVAGIAIGILEQSLYFFSRNPSLASAVMLPVLLAAMLLQRRSLSRGEDTGLATWRQASEFRPVPPELRRLPEVAWARLGLLVVVLGGALLLPFVAHVDQQAEATTVLCYAIVAVSLVILTGWAGQISLGQWGFAGVGAFVAGSLAARHGVDFFVTIAAAGLVGAACSLIIGLPALRIQGLYLAVTTLAFAIAVQVYLLSPNYFGGILPNTEHDLRRPLLYGRYAMDGPRPMYFMTLAFLVLALMSARAVRASRAGRVMVAARDNRRGAQSYGVSVSRARIAAFAIAGFWAAVAGALFAYNVRAIDTLSYGPDISITLVIIVVIGGVTSLPGALAAAAVLGFLKYGGFSQGTQSLASGFGALVLLMVLPGGLAQALYGGRDSLLRWLADRKHIVVPSLLADIASPTEVDAPAHVALSSSPMVGQVAVEEVPA
jgi:branched-chain amino acid transport system permease protein